jgi:methylphosphotriester-DNA--protein-cysteine methyltransferase
MFYQKFPPIAALVPFLECYYIWQDSDLKNRPFIVESPPSAYSAIVINCGDDYYVLPKDKEWQIVPKQAIVGQLTNSYSLKFTGHIHTAAIVFKPAALSAIFKLNVFALVNERTHLRIVVNEEGELNALHAGLRAAADAPRQAKLLENFVLTYFNKYRIKDDTINKAANYIVEQNGQVNIDELCRQFFISRRQFERKFLQRTGLSPKYYARMRRISYLCAQMAGKKEVNWQDLYYNLDYYDQSHFIKDFTEFTGRSPSDYFQNNKELIHHLQKK